jgi:hypothetical protein
MAASSQVARVNARSLAGCSHHADHRPAHQGADREHDRVADVEQHARQVEALGLPGEVGDGGAHQHADQAAERVLQGVALGQPDRAEHRRDGHRGPDRGTEVAREAVDHHEQDAGQADLGQAAAAAEGLEHGGLVRGEALLVRGLGQAGLGRGLWRRGGGFG